MRRREEEEKCCNLIFFCTCWGKNRAGRLSAFSVLWFMIFQLEEKRIINQGKQEKLHVSKERTLELVWSFMCAYLCICSGPSVISLSTRTASWRNTSTSQGEPNTQAVSHLASHVKYYVTRSEPRLLTQTSVSEYNRLGPGVLVKPPFIASTGEQPGRENYSGLVQNHSGAGTLALGAVEGECSQEQMNATINLQVL